MGGSQKKSDFSKIIYMPNASRLPDIYLFVFIYIYFISVISIKLKNISAWVFSCELAAYFQNTFLEEYLREFSGILFFDLFIILLLFFIILHCGSILNKKIKRHFQKQTWCVPGKFIRTQKSYFRKSYMPNRIRDCFPTVSCGR